MDSLKMSISKGISALNVKTNNYLEESKCRSSITALENDIAKIEMEIGHLIYEKWLRDQESLPEIEEFLKQIKGKQLDIEVQKKMIARLQIEERQKAGPSGVSEPITGEALYCTHCGNRNSADDLFCSNCGQPLK
ncbi:MAG: zinc ribbon domain-containing protein [Lachnospiraceae bacterium]